MDLPLTQIGRLLYFLTNVVVSKWTANRWPLPLCLFSRTKWPNFWTTNIPKFHRTQPKVDQILCSDSSMFAHLSLPLFQPLSFHSNCLTLIAWGARSSLTLALARVNTCPGQITSGQKLDNINSPLPARNSTPAANSSSLLR